MGDIINNIIELGKAIANVDWTGFMIQLAVSWFLLEKGLKIIAKLTPWQFDDDLIDTVSRFFARFKR